jgi:cytochrome P450
MRIEQFAIPLIRTVANRPRLAEFLFSFDKWENPFGAQSFRDPYPGIEIARRDGNVSYRGLYRQWFILGHEEIRQLIASEAVVSGGQIDMLLRVRPYSQLDTRAKWVFRNLLVALDPPDHTRLRRLVHKAFTPRRVAELEPRVAQISGELLAALVDQAEPEMVAGFTAPLAVNVIADMIGLPRERWEWSRRTTAEVVKLLDPFLGFDPAVVNAAIADTFDIYGELIEQRRNEPQDDLLTALVKVEDDGERLSRDELILMMAFLMSAGHETTTGLLGNAIVALARHPDQRALLKSQPDIWPNAVEELCRYDTSLRIGQRMAVRDVKVGDVTIPAGANITLSWEGANRDPRRYDAPDQLRLDRVDPKPISFGHGAHFCLGAALARLEMRVGLKAVLDAFGDYEVDLDAVEWRRSVALRGPTRLPVKIKTGSNRASGKT